MVNANNSEKGLCALTQHAKKRLTERVGCNGHTAARIVTAAYYHGDTPDGYTGKEKDYLKNKASKRQSSQIRVFADCCFVYMPDTANKHAAVCVTVFAIPAWFGGKTPAKPRKKRAGNKGVPVRKPKKFIKLNRYYDDEKYA